MADRSRSRRPATPLELEMLETLQWAIASMNWIDECPEEHLQFVPELRVMVRNVIMKSRAQLAHLPNGVDRDPCPSLMEKVS